jgi:microcystin-dependent protein
MGEPFLGEIKLASFNFAPKGWALCNGQTLPVNQNQALFSLLGTTYGGDGVSTFKLPDLRGRVPVHVGQGIPWGGVGGEAQHALTITEMPPHQHTFAVDATNAAGSNTNVPATGNSLGSSISQAGSGSTNPLYIYNSSLTSPTQVASQMVGNNGGGQPHENRQPYQVITACICLNGIYPSRG